MAENPNPTSNHNLPQPAKGDLDGTWGDTVNDELTQRLEERVTIRDVQSNLGDYTPYEDAAFRAVDTGRLYFGDGSAWNARDIETITDTTDLSDGEIGFYYVDSDDDLIWFDGDTSTN